MDRTNEPLEAEVERKLTAMWPGENERAAARAQLRRYGVEWHENEVERVRLAILKLSEGDFAKLQHNIEVAKRDYRNVLMWAEYPEESKALWSVSPSLTEDQRRELDQIRARDREQTDDWRRK